MFVMGAVSTNPVPADLTDACKPQTVKAVNGNYSYTSYDHCAV